MMGLFSSIGRTLPKEGWRMWHAVLKDLPLADLQLAVVQWLAEHDSGFPTPAALRKLAIESRDGATETYCDFMEEFFEIKRRISAHYQPEEFIAALSLTLRGAVLSLGGASWAADLVVADRGIWSAQLREAIKTTHQDQQRIAQLPESLRPAAKAKREPPLIQSLIVFGGTLAVAKVAKRLEAPNDIAPVMPSESEFEAQKQDQLATLRERFPLTASPLGDPR
jgi:hypothetical protein